jgi:hypothetical protein
MHRKHCWCDFWETNNLKIDRFLARGRQNIKFQFRKIPFYYTINRKTPVEWRSGESLSPQTAPVLSAIMRDYLFRSNRMGRRVNAMGGETPKKSVYAVFGF